MSDPKPSSSDRSETPKAGCFTFSGWALFAIGFLVFLVFAVIITLHQLGIWDEFWDNVLR